jgi:hypothetical protein
MTADLVQKHTLHLLALSRNRTITEPTQHSCYAIPILKSQSAMFAAVLFNCIFQISNTTFQLFHLNGETILLGITAHTCGVLMTRITCQHIHDRSIVLSLCNSASGITYTSYVTRQTVGMDDVSCHSSIRTKCIEYVHL